MHRISLLALLSLFITTASAQEDLAAVQKEAAQWRREKRLIDMHMHINMTPQHLDRAVKIMDAAGIGIGVNLGTGTTTPGKDAGPSDFERNKRLADTRHPGRFLHYMILDYRGWDEPDFSQRAVKQIEDGHRLGAAGIKEFKRLGLYLRDKNNKLIKIDDPKLDPVWKRCGELNMPVSIHVADPKAFWLPYDEKNERWKELKDHRNWWFGDPNRFPAWKDLLEALNRVIERNPKTTFVCVHFANNPEELEWVDASLSKYPNMNADLAARIPEIGRHDPDKVRQLFIKHQDRIFFGTDFQVYDRLILGSSGNEPPPTDRDGEIFFEKHWRFLETRDRDWPHMTPIQGDWNISSIGLPADVLRKIYFENARRILARSLPAPTLKAAHIDIDFQIDADALANPNWEKAAPVTIDRTLREGSPRPALATTVRSLWSPTSLYFKFECPYTTLTVFEPPMENQERMGLWDRDVVEVFLGTDPESIKKYAEYEVAPTNERLDVLIDLPEKDFKWSSGFQSIVRKSSTTWTAVLRVPLASPLKQLPTPGARWRLNLFRSDRANNAFLAWNPTLTNTTHTPERFGSLEFAD